MMLQQALQQGAAAGASKSVPAPTPQQAQQQGAAGTQAQQPPQQPTQRVTRAQVKCALKNVRSLKFNLDRQIVRMQSAARLNEDDDTEASRAKLQEMEAGSAVCNLNE
jgi:hypothetical protein